MHRDLTLERYLERAAAGEPAPGGGSVSALVAALAASMGEMAANFTVGRPKFADAEERIRVLLGDLTAARRACLDLVDRDSEAYGALAEALQMPGRSKEEKAARRRSVAQASLEAMQPPLEVMRLCARIGRAAEELVRIANPNLASDVGVCAVLAEAACAGARLNVEVNLRAAEDDAARRRTEAEMIELTEAVVRARRDVEEELRRRAG